MTTGTIWKCSCCFLRKLFNLISRKKTKLNILIYFYLLVLFAVVWYLVSRLISKSAWMSVRRWCMSERRDFKNFLLQVINLCNVQFFANKFVFTVLIYLPDSAENWYTCTFYDDERLKLLIFSKLLLVVANIGKLRFFVFEEIKTTKNIILTSIYWILFKF